MAAARYVKPFVKRQKNDSADAEAIAEAAGRPTMRFVAVKNEEKQALGMSFRARDLLVRQRTGHLAEFGIIAPQGAAHVSRLRQAVNDPAMKLPTEVLEIASMLLEQIDALQKKIAALEGRIRSRAQQDERAARLMTIPGVGPICAAAIESFAPSMEGFRRGRDFAAWLGLTPRQHSTGGKNILGRCRRWGSATFVGC